MQSYSCRRTPPHHPAGSTLVVVLVLLALLAVLGFTFFTFSAQERAAAEYFASESIDRATGIPDNIFDWPLRQIIIGPDDKTFNSVLWGGRFSLVPTMLGPDLLPFNGEGVHLIATAGQPHVDQNYDGTADTSDALLDIVDSPAANNGVKFGAAKAASTIPSPDVDYSYPDINSMLLSYDGFALDASSNLQRVIIPSLLRPQYLRSGGTMIMNWFNDPGVTAAQSFRPHSSHVYIDSSGTSTAIKRYVQTQADASTLGLTSTFSFAPLTSSGATTTGQLGIWTGSGPTTINLDVDTDGDGINESILVDLDYPPFRRPDGKLVVPLFAIQVRDLNGLINLNSATTALTKTIPTPANLVTQEFGSDASGNPIYLSSSNQGQQASEVNSVYGLTADISSLTIDDVEQYKFFLKNLGADRNPLSAREIANLEWFFISHGRPKYHAASAAAATAGFTGMFPTIEAVVPGILGDSSQLMSFLSTGNWNLLPRPGKFGTDDNLDTTNTFPFIWTSSSTNPSLGSPMDLVGGGSFVLPNTGGINPFGKSLNFLTRTTQPTVGANRWLIFNSYHSNNDVALSTSAAFGTLLMPQVANDLTDDPSELVVDPAAIVAGNQILPAGNSQAAMQNDAIFGPLDTAFLQESNLDGAAIRVSSRISELAPVNTVTNSTAFNTRSQYTTLSTSRREYAEITTSLSNATTPVASDQQRTWESSYLTTSANSRLRPVVWSLLSGSSTLSARQLRLSVNQLLTDNNGEPLPTGTVSGLAFRDLTAHPSSSASLANTVITSPGSYSGPTFGTPAAQEFYARRDRQAMARDIYTLLYLFGAGFDQDPKSASSTLSYSADQKREMAQFAVNYVDALDTDNVMTRFEYDTDLITNGWSLDDDPYTTTDSVDRKEVWGVEAQQLSISEGLFIKAPIVRTTAGVATNHAATEYDDTSDRFFSYIDLQNCSPYIVNFNNQAWQIRLYPKGIQSVTPPDTTLQSEERRLTFKTGAVAAGSLFTIMSSGDAGTFDSAGMKTSNFKVDPNYVTSGTPNRVLIAPTIDLNLSANLPNRLDLMVDPNTAYSLTDGSSPPTTLGNYGDLFNSTNAADMSSATSYPIVIKLMRRADPYRLAPTPGDATQEADNPWIEVDQMQIGIYGTTATTPVGKSGLKQFLLKAEDDSTSSPSIADRLKTLLSHYRDEPFAADFELDFVPSQAWTTSGTANPSSVNFIGSGKYDQSGSPAPAVPSPKYSQFHFDRPYSSFGELFEIPLVSPGLTVDGIQYDPAVTWHATRALGYANKSPVSQLNAPTSGTPERRALTAIGKFLLADFPDSIDPVTTKDNRWYRLLEFFEVASPAHRHQDLRTFANTTLGYPKNFGWPQLQGQVNLNLLRHSAGLAGLLDDNLVLNVQTPATGGLPTTLPGRDTADQGNYTGTPATRDWWIEFARSRDGQDSAPSSSPTSNFTIPGTADSHPFRSFNFTSRGKTSQQRDSLFRALPTDIADPMVTDQRALFEIGPQSDHASGTSSDSLARHRLLSKAMNNITTRSNSYGIFIGIQFFEAATQTVSGKTAVRIGGRMNDMPTKRAFFVVDRTGVMEQIRQLDSNGINPVSTTTFSYTPNTDTSGTPANQNGIKWQDLIYYRQLIQ